MNKFHSVFVNALLEHETFLEPRLEMSEGAPVIDVVMLAAESPDGLDHVGVDGLEHRRFESRAFACVKFRRIAAAHGLRRLLVLQESVELNGAPAGLEDR